MRRTVPIFAISLLLPVAACSLTTSLDGFSSGSAITPGTDGGSSITSPPESGTDAATDDGGVRTYRDEVLADAPLGYWRLGDTGATAKDETGKNDGTYTGAVTHAPGALAGDADGAAVFDGAGFVDVGDVFPFLGTAPYALEAWVAPASSPADPGCVMAKNAGDPSASPTNGWALYTEVDGPTSNRLNFSRFRNSTEEDARGGALAPGVFAHVVASFDGSSLAIYVDGERAGTGTSTAALTAVANHLTVGASRGGAVCFFRGALDEVAIYGAPLSPDRIRAHHRAGIGR